MDKTIMAATLPTTPREGMLAWAKETCNHYLGGELLLFHRESIAIEPELQRTMTEEDFENHERQTKRRWGALCTCTRCGEEFTAGWASYPEAGVKGIRLYMGEDAIYPGYVEPDENMSIEIGEGDQMVCPWCESNVTLVPESDIRNGRTYQCMVESVEVVDGYTAIVAWLYRRYLHWSGWWDESLKPAEAVVIDEKGKLHKFTHIGHTLGPAMTDLKTWKPIGTVQDPMLTIYYNFDAINHRCVGGKVWKNIPPLAAATGEKTGLAEYIKANGEYPVAYLKLWSRHRYIENLIKTSWRRHVKNNVDEDIKDRMCYDYRDDTVVIDWADLSEAKPGKQLGMNKKEVAELAGKWTVSHLKEWALYRHYAARCSATEFAGYIDTLSLEAVRRLNAYGSDNGIENAVTDGVRYLCRQKMKASTDADLLVDLWNMLDETEAQGREITYEMRFPHNLQAAHDREAANRTARKAKEKAELYAAGFAKVLKKYQALEWSDGELCVRLPRSNGDLVTEGDVLRHCVGGYGEDHIEEKCVVFFVRKARRPERSYYTMDYNFTVPTIKRHQLHGYGNERHGKNKEHSHRIPQKVIDFVDRWEREVLKPWWHKEQQKRKRQEAAAQNNKRSA